MVQPSSSNGIVVVRLRGAPSRAIVEMFAQSFPRHPVARLELAIERAFFDAFARNAALFVASDGADDVGFLIGGSTPELDATRVHFIRAHAWRIAASSARDASLLRLLLPRVKPAKRFGAAPYAGHQLRFVAVAPNARDRGVGSRLVAAFEESLAGTPGYHAWTLAGPHGASGFFSKLGFQRDVTVGAHLRMWRRLDEADRESTREPDAPA
ncbi:MAG TPA: GNAT family N-acetyltransferase [Candidatus Dormibacteraeota bacterium]|nr:GNAT family N-acetyltransferase [Candidatus Dormibacteraeota bacterium]